MIITNLLANMVLMSSLDIIQTNTPAFQEYAYQTMVATAESVADKWHLDKNIISTNHVTEFRASPTVLGISGHIVFQKRYHFAFDFGKYNEFIDFENYRGVTRTQNVETNDLINEQWMRATNLLTMETAKKLAGDSLKAMDIKINYYKPDRLHQLTYTGKDGKTYPLPYYGFEWGDLRFRDGIDISGIIGKPVYFATFYHAIRIKPPTNYFDLLGLPAKPVFVNQVSKKPATYEVILDTANWHQP